MTLRDWASWLLKNPEFSLSDDWLTFLLGVPVMGGGDRTQALWGIQKQPKYYGEKLRALQLFKLFHTGSLYDWISEPGPGKQTPADSRSHGGGLEGMDFLFLILLKANNQPFPKDTTTTSKSPQWISKSDSEKITLAREWSQYIRTDLVPDQTFLQTV